MLELGFHLLPEHWGLGYGSEAACAVIRYAFETFPIKALFAGHHPENHDSRRVLEKLGFQYVGMEYFPPTDLSHFSYRLGREEWMGG